LDYEKMKKCLEGGDVANWIIDYSLLKKVNLNIEI